MRTMAYYMYHHCHCRGFDDVELQIKTGMLLPPQLLIIAIHGFASNLRSISRRQSIGIEVVFILFDCYSGASELCVNWARLSLRTTKSALMSSRVDLNSLPAARSANCINCKIRGALCLHPTGYPRHKGLDPSIRLLIHIIYVTCVPS